MHLVHVGRRWINLDYLILVELWDGSPETGTIPEGGMWVCLESGKEFVLGPPDSDHLTRHLSEAVTPDLADPSPISVTGITERVRDGASGMRSGTSKEPG